MTSFDSSFTSDASQSQPDTSAASAPDQVGSPGADHTEEQPPQDLLVEQSIKPNEAIEATDESEEPAPEGAVDGATPEGAQAAADDSTRGFDERPMLVDDPEIPEAFRDVVARLDEVPGRDVSDHAEVYDAVHRDLRAALDGIERA